MNLLARKFQKQPTSWTHPSDSSLRVKALPPCIDELNRHGLVAMDRVESCRHLIRIDHDLGAELSDCFEQAFKDLLSMNLRQRLNQSRSHEPIGWGLVPAQIYADPCHDPSLTPGLTLLHQYAGHLASPQKKVIGPFEVQRFPQAFAEPVRECVPNHHAQPERPRRRVSRGQPKAGQPLQGPCHGQCQGLPAVLPWPLVLALALPLFPGVNDKSSPKVWRQWDRTAAGLTTQ